MISPEQEEDLDKEIIHDLENLDLEILEWNKKKNSFATKQDRIDWCISHGIETFESVEYRLVQIEKQLGKSREQLLEEEKLGTIEDTELGSTWQEYYSTFCEYKKEEE